MPGFGQGWTSYLNRRLVTAFAMGFASGLPLMMTGSLMQARAQEAGVSLADIGLFSLVGLPYTLKFLWSPLFDSLVPPLLGRRRGWLLLLQVALALGLMALGQVGPGLGPQWVQALVLTAFAVAFLSASQDIVIDAYRREDLLEHELGLGSGYYMYGYRLGMLLAGGGGMILAEALPWAVVYNLLAAALIPAMFFTVLAPEPTVPVRESRGLRGAVVEPFREYLRRPHAWAFLLFILLYKVGDSMAAALTTPFFMEIGYSKAAIGTVAKLFGFWATLAGAFIGGIFVMRRGIGQGLWVFGLAQMVSTLGFSLLAGAPVALPWLGAVVALENLCSGMGTAAFMAFMASLTDKRFTAVQFALLTSLMGVPRVLLSSGSGFLAQGLGWFWFFVFCTALAIPGVWMARRWGRAV
jgi:PAT family beta-lactamase induction signal transducer AmpG